MPIIIPVQKGAFLVPAYPKLFSKNLYIYFDTLSKNIVGPNIENTPSFFTKCVVRNPSSKNICDLLHTTIVVKRNNTIWGTNLSYQSYLFEGYAFGGFDVDNGGLSNRIIYQSVSGTYYWGDYEESSVSQYDSTVEIAGGEQPEPRVFARGFPTPSGFGIFGGWGLDDNGNEIQFSDLWIFDATKGVWVKEDGLGAWKAMVSSL